MGTVKKIRLTVINRDPTILIKAESTSVVEGQPARFILERKWAADLLELPPRQSRTVAYLRAYQDGQYITGALPNQITFGQNETRKVIELTTVDDSAFGDDGSVTIELLPDTSTGSVNLHGKYTIWESWLGHTPAGGRSDRATVAIANNDTKPGITIAPASATEGDSGSANMTFTLTLAQAVTEAVTVNYVTSDGTASAGSDYTAVANGTVTIPANSTSATFTVSVIGDTTDEADETFNVTISLPEPEPDLNGSGSGEHPAAIAGGATATAAGTIMDDDPVVVTVAPKKSPVVEGEDAVFVLTRAGVTDEELYILVDLEDPAHRRLMIAKFDAAAVTAEVSVATENNGVVDYPSERDYTIQLYGDRYFVDGDDERYTPGDPGEATVTVQDDDTLVVVTVEPVTELVSTGESVQFRFRRTGSTAEALSISFQGFEHPSSGDATLADASVTFPAGNDTVVYTNDVTSNGTVNPISRAHTVLIYGDAGRGGLHRSWIAGTPNRATVVVAVDVLGPMPVTASYPGRVAADESVSVVYKVTNLGERALPGFSNRVTDGTKITTSPNRGSCDIRDAIPAGESRTCSASFTVTNQDATNGKIEFNATARNHNQSSTVHVYIRVAQPVEFGFTTADTLEVTEGPDVTATLPVTRTGRLDEAATVAYRLRPQGIKPANLGEDFTDPSSTPGLLTFPADETSANIVINIAQDQIDEERERFRVVLVPLADGTIGEGKESRVVLIIDEHQDDDPYRPTASLELLSADPTPENAGSVDFAVVLDRVWGEHARFEVELDAHDNLTATPSNAGLGLTGDFDPPNGIIHATIPAGQTRFEFSLALHDDDVREEDETFQMLLGSSIDRYFRLIGDDDTALVTIADDDLVEPTGVELSLTRNNEAFESMAENSSRRDITVTTSFPLIRWPTDAADAPLRPADPRDVDTIVRVTVDHSNSTASLADIERFQAADAQSEFREVESFDIVIPADRTSGTTTLRFKPVNDEVDEEDETVTLQGTEVVAADSGEFLPVNSTSFTITDDDTRGITISPSSALDGLSLVEGGEPGTYSLVLDSQPTDTVVITLAGNQGGFLRIVPDTLTFTTSDWATPQTVSVMALDDGIAGSVSPTNFVTHQVSRGDYGSETLPDISATIEDTTEAYIYLEDAQASESDGYVEFTVSVRPVLRATPVVVRYATVDGTAVAGTDYTREVTTAQAYKTFTISEGQGTGAIRIPITDNQVYGPANKTFTLQLTNHNDKANLEGDATSLTATGTINDDDPKPVVGVKGPGGEVSYVSEALTSPVTFTLTLTGRSAADVTVDYATGEAQVLSGLSARQGITGATAGEDYTAATGSVTFNPGETTQQVTVQLTDDDVSEDTEFFGFRISNAQNAQLRNKATEEVADVALLDDDPRGVTVDPTSISLDEPASGETAATSSYTVKLNSKPTDTVTVAIGGADPAVTLSGDALSNTNTLTFTTSNWDTAQTVTVTPVEDANGTGETITLTHTQSGGDYTGIAADSVTVNVTDSDTRNVVLSPTSFTLTEGDGTGATYTVKLATEPSETVTVTIGGHSGTALSISGTAMTGDTLTFTASSWDTAQTVTVKAGEDANAGDESETLTHTASGGDYASVSQDLPVTITDDDTATIVLSETELTVTEGDGIGASYTVKLATEPSETVTVTIGGHTGTDLTLSGTALTGNTLTFTGSNWDTAQTVTVKAGQDSNAGGESEKLTHTASGGDYASVSKDLLVTVEDDDTAAIVLSESALTVTEGDTTGASYTVKLSTQPTGAVTVTIDGHSGTDLTVSGTTLNASGELTFTTSNWDTAQTVTVKAGEDANAADEDETLTHTASGGDYGSVTKDLPVTVEDDAPETVAVSFGSASYTVTEGSTVTVTVSLDDDPERTVIIPIESDDEGGASGSDYSGVPGSVTFDAGDTSKTFDISATEDNLAESGEKVKLSFGTLPADATAATPVESTVSIHDRTQEQGLPTPPTVHFENAAYTVDEGASVAVKVILNKAPGSEAVIPISRTDRAGATGADYSGVPNSLTFGAAETEKVITFAATDDSVDDDGEQVELSFGALPGNTTATSGEAAESVVTIADDDIPASLTVSFGAASYTAAEGSTVTVTVTLSDDPETDLTIPISKSNEGGATNADYSGVPESVTFEAGDTSKTFIFTAASDSVDDDGESVKLSFGTLPTTPIAVTAGTTGESTVTITDDDTAAIVLSESALTVTEGDTTGAGYTVKLSTQPTDTVTVTIGGHSGTALTVSGTTLSNTNTLTFTTSNWGTAQTVTVKADEDANAADEEETLTHTASGGDYAGVTKDLTVNITDDAPETVTVSFGAASYTVTEGGSKTVTVNLDDDPERRVIIPIETDDEGGASGSDYSGVPENVTFDAGETSKTFDISATEDNLAESGEKVKLSFGTLPTDATAGTPNEASVSIHDRTQGQGLPTPPTIHFENAAYSVTEGASTSIKVILSKGPGSDVVIPISRTDRAGATASDYSGVPDSLTFGPTDTEKVITFAATDDSVDDDGEQVELSFGTLPGGITSTSGEAAESVVTITDDDMPASLTVSFGAASYTAAEGSAVTVTVTLSDDPESDLTIPVDSSNEGGATNADYSGVPESVTFAAGDTSKTFVFTAAADNVDDDDESVKLSFGTLPTTPISVTAGTTGESTVTITDDDTAAIVLSESALTVTEGDTTGAGYTVKLATQPTGTVTVTIGGHGGTALTVSGTTLNAGNELTFTASNWSTAQTVTVKADEDSNADDEEETLTHTASGGDYGSVTKDLPVTVEDDAPETVAVSFGSASYTVTEGSTVTVTVSLDDDPERTVIIPIESDDEGGASGSDYSGVPGSVTFDAGDTSKTFDISATEDNLAESGEKVKLSFGTLPADATAATPVESTVSIHDRTQEQGLPTPPTVHFENAAYTVDEGASISIKVILSKAPGSEAVIPISRTDRAGATGADYSGVPNSLTFGAAETEKVITFAATDDSVDDDGEKVELSFSALPGGITATSGEAAEAMVTIADDDRPAALTVSFGAASYTAAEGSTVTVTVTLSDDPETDLTIPIDSSNEGGATSPDYSGVPESVTFAAGDTSKTFVFTAAADNVDDDGESVKLSFGTLPTTPISVTAGTTGEATVTITDDDTAAIVLSESSLTVTEGDTTGAGYTVKLSTQPSETVTVTIGGHSGTALSISGTTLNASDELTFTASSWDTAQTVTVKAGEDANAGDEEETLTHTASGGDYASVSKDLPVTVEDDAPETLTVSFGAASYTAAEGSTVTVTVTLSDDPETDLTIPIDSSNEGGATSADYSGVPESVTFAAGDTSKTFIFTAAADDVDDDGESVKLSFGTLPTTPIAVTAGTTGESTVTITDDDTAAIVLSETALTVTEGDTTGAGYTVKLSTEPSGTVTVTIGGHSGTALTVSGTTLSGNTLTYTASSWDTAQTVTVKADEDANARDESETLTHTASGGDYSSLTKDLPVTVEDDAPETVAVSFGAASYTAAEGSTVTVTVSLDDDPERTVIIPIESDDEGGASGSDYSGVPENVTFDAGDTSKTFDISATEDNLAESGEKVKLSFGTLPSAATAGTPVEATVSIHDRTQEQGLPTPPTVHFENAAHTVDEGASVAVKVILSKAPGSEAVIPISRTDRAGATGADYSGVPNSLTFGAAETEKVITFAATDDSVDDDGEKVELSFSTLPGGITSTSGEAAESVVTITDDDMPASVTVSFGAASYTAAEGSTVTVTVTLSDDPETDLTIPIDSSNEGGATSADYSGVPENVTFAAGDTSKTFVFTAAADNVDDDGESVKLSFGTLPTTPIAVTAGTTGEATVTITDDDTASIVLSESSLTVTEGDTTGASYTVKLSTQPSGTVTVTIGGHGGTALSILGTALSGDTLSFTASNWDTAQTVTVKADEDSNAADEEETLTHTASGGDYASVTKDLTVTVEDDAPETVAVSFGAASYTVTEGSSRTVTVSLDDDPERTVIIPIETEDEGGASGSDYSGVPESVTFDAGETEKTFDISATEDNLAESGEKVRLSFGSLPTDATAGTPNEATVSIHDRTQGQGLPTPPTIHFENAAYSVTEGASTSIKVILSKGPGSDVVIPISRTDRAGATASDYSGVPDSLTFGPTDTEKVITFASTDDSVDDDGEQVELSFGALPGNITATSGEAAESVVTIADDDIPALLTVSFGAASYTAAEGSTVTVTVTLSDDPETDLTIPIGRSDEGGATSADYSGVPESVTFEAGDTSKTFVFTAASDSIDDDGESVKLSFGTLPTTPIAVTAGTTAEATVTITDDDTAAIVLSESALTVTEGDTTGAGYTVKLATQPTGTVTVTIGGHSGTALTVSGTTLNAGNELTFTASNWDAAQTVTVKADEDSNADDEEETLTHTASGGDYAGVTKDLTVNITDDAPETVTVSFGAASYTAVEGSTVTVTVSLDDDPERRVIIPIESDDEGGASGSDYSGVPESLTFDAGETSKTFDISATEDNLAESGEKVKLSFGTLPTDATAGTPNEASVSIHDRTQGQGLPTPPTIHFENAAYSVTEGASTSIKVILSKGPGSDVVIPISRTDRAGATASDYSGVPDSLTFGPTDTEKVITFAATDDSVDDDGEQVELSFGALPGNITATSGEAAESVVTIADDDIPASVTVSFGAASYTAAEGSTVTVTVTLSDDPETDLTIPIDSSNEGGATSADYSGVPESVTFAAGDTSKTFVFTAAADSVDDDGESVKLSFGTLPTTPISVTAGATAEATVTITDDDTAAIVLSESSLTVTEGDTTGASYTVKLSTQPSGTVTVTIGGHGGTALTVSGTTLNAGNELTFTASNWSAAQTVTVKADEDSNAADEEETLTHTASGGDYAGVTKDLTVNITDDVPEIIIDNESSADCNSAIWCADLEFRSESQPGEMWSLASKFLDSQFHYGDATYSFGHMGVAPYGHNIPMNGQPSPPFAIPERTKFYLSLRNMNASGYDLDRFRVPNDDWMDWTLHISTTKNGETLTAVLPLSEARYGEGNWAEWRWYGSDLEALRAAWTEGQVYKLKIVEDPRSERTPKVLGPPLYLKLSQHNDHELHAWWKMPENRVDRAPPDTTYKVQWKEATGSWDNPADVSEEIDSPASATSEMASYTIRGLTGGVEYHVRVIATNPVGDSEPSDVVSGSPTPLLAAVQDQVVGNTSAEGAPVIDGTADVGQTLSAVTTGITDVDGLQDVVFGYQWLADDVEISGADSATYTLTSDDLSKTIKVRVDFTDDGGNEESLTSAPTAAVTAAEDLDLQSATVDGSTLTLTYNASLDTGVTLSTSAFTVNVNGWSRSLIGVGVGTSSVLLFLSPAVESGVTVTVDYAKPSGSNVIKDTQGGQADSFTGQAVTNNTAPAETERSEPVQAPGSPNSLKVVRHESGKLMATWAAPDSGSDPTGYTLQWKEAGDSWETQDSVSQADVKGTSHLITGLTDGTEYAIRVISTTDDAESDPSGEVTATPQETVPPTATVASVDGATLSITFDEPLDAGRAPDKTAFSVAVGGSSRGVDAVSVSGTTVTLTLAAAVEASDTVTVSYTAPTGESAVGLQDLAGNAAESFSGQQVTNTTPPAQVEAPAPPRNLEVARQGGGKLTASWDAPNSGPSPTGYTLQWKESANDWANQDDISEAEVTGTSHVITGLTDGTEYAIRVISTTDDAESDPSGEVTATPQETVPPTATVASVDGATLSITFDEPLDAGRAPDKTAFSVAVGGSSRGVDAVSVSGSVVTLSLVTAVFAGDEVTVSYTPPTGESANKLQDLAGNAAASFSGQAVTNATQEADRFTATVHAVPLAHDGSSTFIFELRFSESPRKGFSYKIMRDHAFTVTGGDVTKARRLEQKMNIRWETHVTPSWIEAVTILLPPTTDCTAEGAICTQDRRPLSNTLEIVIPGPGG